MTLLVAGVAGVGWFARWNRYQQAPEADQRRVLNVAAASDLRYAFDEIVSRFSAMHPHTTVRVSYGSTGQLFAQLSEEAPFDLFLSADIGYVERLVQQGKADRDSVFVYAVGRLVLWVPEQSPLDPEVMEMGLLLEPSVKRVAMANPRHAPYGRLAEAALRAAHVYEKVADKLVLGDNVSQAAQFVQSGAADAGLIAYSLALSPVLRNRGKYWLIPETLAPALIQAGVVPATSNDRRTAEMLRDFMLSEEGCRILQNYGFFTPNPQAAKSTIPLNDITSPAGSGVSP